MVKLGMLKDNLPKGFKNVKAYRDHLISELLLVIDNPAGCPHAELYDIVENHVKGCIPIEFLNLLIRSYAVDVTHQLLAKTRREGKTQSNGEVELLETNLQQEDIETISARNAVSIQGRLENQKQFAERHGQVQKSRDLQALQSLATELFTS